MLKIVDIASIILFLMVTSCNIEQKGSIEDPNGFWEQDGYGKVIQIQDSIISVYNICKVDCHLAFEEEILDFGRIKKVTKDSLVIKHNIDDWKFYRIKELPKLCINPSKEKQQNAVHNFETFWHTFKEHYCSFDVKQVDWDKIYQKYSSKISSETSKLELYLTLKEMTSLLNDGHIDIELPNEIEEEYKQSQVKKEVKYSKLDEFELHKELATLYVDSLRNYNGGVVRWGMIENEVGYIQFNTMWMIANYNIAPDLGLLETYQFYEKTAKDIKDEILREDEEKGAAYIMDTILADLSDAKSYILDLRFNGGGKDGVAMQIMNRFAQKRKKVASKYVKFKNSSTAYQNIYVNPASTNFTGKVIILTSHLTASAAELAVLASLSSPNMQRIGSKTEGIFSSTLDKTLPNGWEYELSNEIYNDLNGNNYENIGISPDIKLDYSMNKDAFLDQLKEGIDKEKDEAIELALKIK